MCLALSAVIYHVCIALEGRDELTYITNLFVFILCSIEQGVC